MRPLKPADPEIADDLNAALKQALGHRTAILLCDENTLKYCLPHLNITFRHTLVIRPGEQEKSLQTAENIWKHLANWKTGRDEVLVCLGGGVVCDLGAFCASVYRRGIPCILLPSTLLAMTDAAIGGKTGVNLLHWKNYIGTFSEPNSILIHLPFLETLNADLLNEGWAEIAKHALIADAHLFDILTGLSALNGIPNLEILKRSMAVKSQIVREDPLERDQRKLLNFGHTIGHALESWYLERNQPAPHGKAVAAGMWMESWLSWKQGLLTTHDFEAVRKLIDLHFEPLMYGTDGVESIAGLCIFDKKNEQGGPVNFTALLIPGKARIDTFATAEELKSALHTYLEWHR